MDNKKDITLGMQIHQLLLGLGFEVPTGGKFNIQLIRDGIEQVLTGLGLNLHDASIAKTPNRVTEFFIEEIYYGLDYANFPQVSFTANEYNYDEPVIADGIIFNSTCEHHLVNISGVAHIAYIPNERLIGLSKINRIVDFFAKRPQIQERATMQIFHALKFILDTDDIAVVIKAEHHCVTMRSINGHGTQNTTCKFGGKFLLDNFRKDFISLIKNDLR